MSSNDFFGFLPERVQRFLTWDGSNEDYLISVVEGYSCPSVAYTAEVADDGGGTNVFKITETWTKFEDQPNQWDPVSANFYRGQSFCRVPKAEIYARAQQNNLVVPNILPQAQPIQLLGFESHGGSFTGDSHAQYYAVEARLVDGVMAFVKPQESWLPQTYAGMDYDEDPAGYPR